MHGSSLLGTAEPTGCNKVRYLPHRPRSDALHPVHPLYVVGQAHQIPFPADEIHTAQQELEITRGDGRGDVGIRGGLREYE